MDRIRQSDAQDMTLRFTLRQLEYFVATGEVGSIALASERISVSSPSISGAIAQLEAEFGLQLFVRHHAQGLSLTPGGRRFFSEAKMLLDQAARLHDLAADISDRVSGPLAIGCFATLAPLLLAELRRTFEADYRGTRPTQMIGSQPQLIAALRRAEIDIALTYDLEIPADLCFRPCASLSPHVLLPAGHRLANETDIALDAIADEPFILLDLPMSRDYLLALFHERGLRPRVVERVGDIALVHTLVANGFGYSLVNVRPMGGRAPDGKPLVERVLSGENRAMQLGTATMRSERRPRIVSAFEDHCARLIGDGHLPGLGA